MGSIGQNRNTGIGNTGYRGTNMATGGFNRNTGGGYNRNAGGGFASSGGFNRNNGINKNNYGRQSYPQTSRYTKGSGIGSALRSNTFKNMLVGAAAGYLAYQGGKFLIRNAMSPMMWNNRPYYWGQNYYQPRPNTQMCRMPVDPSDPQLGNVYMQNNQRPREIVWGCGYNEHCCGYECCPGTMGMGMGGSSMGGGYPMNTGGGMPAAGVGAIAGAGASESALGHGLSVRPSQSVGVRGQLRCNGMPAAGVLVKLYDHDTFTMDDKIASGRTDPLGNFLLAGHEHEFTRVTPKLNIYHDCNDWLPCQRKISIYIPKEFVSQGEVAQRIYDTGVMELAGSFEGESRDCFH
ncbi:transthyretin-like family domain-containing protein [Ditylenchus destructor]|uniref:Transthyretin-like family domain-containing protein n=1 Tax=Ditylenchus destructor TaxID=166010 RepID=A0AAD4MVD4_9BILA|nr:transthyretin-like family domain-containing protein [Ditylenchus destructor]